jgi:hypothetical protein
MVRSKVNEMNWDSLTGLLTRHQRDIEMDQGSHMVLLVQPDPVHSATPTTTIVTNTVGQLLWARDSDKKWQNHHKLFKTLLREPSAQSFVGSIFEQAFHGLCVRGAELDLLPMALQSAGSVNSIFKNNRPESGDGSIKLTLEGYTPIFFGAQCPITELLPKRYYQSITTNHPSYDSFVYDPDSHQIYAFQATIGKKHDLTSTGVRALRDLGRQLHIDDLKIRIIVVGFEDAPITYQVEWDLYDNLGLELYAIWATETQLYPYSSVH